MVPYFLYHLYLLSDHKRVRKTNMIVSWPGLVSSSLSRVQMWTSYVKQACVGSWGLSQASSLNSVQKLCVYGDILSSRAQTWGGTRVSFALLLFLFRRASALIRVSDRLLHGCHFHGWGKVCRKWEWLIQPGIVGCYLNKVLAMEHYLSLKNICHATLP